MEYKRLTRGFYDKGQLFPANYNFTQLLNSTQDFYLSTYKYNDKHYATFKQVGSIAGIKDVITDKLWWDFDSKDNLELAQQATVELCKRLFNHGINEENILIYFSGNKGFGVELFLTENLTPDEAKSICSHLAMGIDEFDDSLYDAAQVLRIPGTRHQVSGLFKIRIDYSELANCSIEEIKSIATNQDFTNSTNPINLPESLKSLKSMVVVKQAPAIEGDSEVLESIDFNKKIKGFTNCKWALLQGYEMKPGDRHDKIVALIAQAKALNFTESQARALVVDACAKGVEIYGGDDASIEDIDNAIKSVYSHTWKGGTYSCKDGKSPWLAAICESLGVHECPDHQKSSLVDVQDVFSEFATFAKDIDKNTIKTGIQDLDDQLRILVGQMVGILGAPSSGKSSLALEILENVSNEGLLSVFYSLDMASSELYQKIAQRVTGYTSDRLYNIFKTNPEESRLIGQLVSQAYKNVKFCFDTGVSAERIEQTIEEFEQTTQQKVKLLMLDYNELLSSPYSDPTASSGYNAGVLKKITNTRGICTISLLQPPKHVGDAGDEITSYRNIKGSSLLEQCFSTIIGIFRPGFTIRELDGEFKDKYMVMKCLKNRMGGTFNLSFYWEGLRGKITSIDAEGIAEIKQLMEEKKQKPSLSNFP